MQVVNFPKDDASSEQNDDPYSQPIYYTVEEQFENYENYRKPEKENPNESGHENDIPLEKVV